MHAPDPDAAHEAHVAHAARVRRLGVGGVQDVVLIDVQPARTTELRPRGDVLAILREDLQAAVAAVAHEEPALRVHRQRVRIAELAVLPAGAAPLHQVAAVAVELHDAVVAAGAVAVDDEDRAVVG